MVRLARATSADCNHESQGLSLLCLVIALCAMDLEDCFAIVPADVFLLSTATGHDGGLPLDAEHDLMASFATPVPNRLCELPPDDNNECTSEGPGEHMPATSDASVGKKRGRPPGSRNKPKVLDSLDDGEAPAKLSKAARASRAAAARWQQVADNAAESEAPMSELAIPKAADLQIQLYDGHSDMKSLVEHILKPVQNKTPTRDQLRLMSVANHCVSVKAIGQSMRIDEKTVRRRMRLMSATMLIGCRVRMMFAISAVDSFLHDKCNDCRRLMWTTKQRYDEMEIRLTLTEAVKALVGKTKEHKDKVRVKLMQVTVVHQALWQAGGKFLSMNATLPTALQPIEKTSGACVKAVVMKQAKCPDWAQKHFKNRTRLSIKDDHRSNHAADRSAFQDDQWETLIESICNNHKVQKVAELISRIFRGETAGIMNGTLALNWGGAFWSFKKNLKKYIRTFLKVYAHGDVGAGDECDQRREKVWSTFCHSEDNRLTGPRARARQRRMFVRRKLVNGNFDVLDEWQHYCRGWPGCCRSEAHTIDQLMEEFIDDLERPRVWCLSRWIGLEDALDMFGELLSTHGVLYPVVLMTWFGMSPQEANAALIKLHSDVDLPGQDVELDLQEPAATADDSVRQSTYRINLRNWLQSMPDARLWILKNGLHWQQYAQKMYLQESSPAWCLQQMQLDLAGEERQYHLYNNCEGVVTCPMINGFKEMLVTEDAWHVLPNVFRTHRTALDGFRATSRALCASHELLTTREKQYPCAGAALIRKDSNEASRCADRMLFDWETRPCIFDHWTYWLLSEFPHKAMLLSPEAIALQTQIVSLWEGQNASTEANNASIRRRVCQHFQCKSPQTQDVNVDWVLKWNRQEADRVHGGWDACDDETDDSDLANFEAMVSGGGGTCRAFFSKYAKDYKLPNGKCDFVTLHRLYKMQLEQRGECALWEELKESANAAMRSHRARWDSGDSANYISNFGTVHPRRQDVSAARDAEDEAMLMDLDARLAACRRSLHGCTTDLAIINQSEMTAVSQLVTARSGNCVKDQMRTLDRLCFVVGKREKKQLDAGIDRLKEQLSQAPQLPDLDLKDVEMPEFSKVVLENGALPCLHYRDNATSYASKKVGELTKHRSGDVAERLLEFMDSESRLVHESDCSEIQPTHSIFKPTFCFQFGHGECLCRIPGRYWDWARHKLTFWLLGMCPSGTPLRIWLLDAYLIVRLQARYFHVALMYLNPRRPTFMEVFLDRELPGGRIVVNAKLVDGQSTVLNEIELMKSLDLSVPINMTLYKLTSVKKEHQPFVVGNELLATPCEYEQRMQTNNVTFWPGIEAETAERQEQARKAAVAAAKRAAKAKAKAAPVQVDARPQVRPERQRRAPPRDPTLPLLLEPLEMDGRHAEFDEFDGAVGGDIFQQDWADGVAEEQAQAVEPEASGDDTTWSLT